MNALVIGLPSAEATAERVGGKAANLSRLLALGLPVPAAFAVPAEAFRACLSRPRLLALVDSAAAAPAGERAEPLRALREAIEAEPLDGALAAALAEAVRALGEGELAVRSSAVSEDSAARSFAGQHDTVLGVRGADGCARALRRCWASAFSCHALEYRLRAGLDARESEMAVVVQRMVPAERAGVLFTCDPVSGGADRLVIEAVPGLGEGLVSGRLQPDRWVLDRATLSVLDHAAAVKPFAVRPLAEGGVADSPLPEPESKAACLTSKQLLELARLGLRVEEKLGGPQDLEWAYGPQGLQLLQARPVTTAVRAASAEDRIVWSNTNLGELLPDAATPLSFSGARRFLTGLLEPLLARVGIDARGLELMGQVAGRPYVNMNAAIALFRRVPGLAARNYADYFGGDREVLAPALAALRESDLPRAGGSKLRTLLRLPGFLLWVARGAFADMAPELAKMRRDTEAVASRPIRGLDDGELLRRAELLFETMRLAPDGFAFALVAVGSAQVLSTLCRKWLGDADGSIAARLLSGVGGFASAEAGLDLWRLSEAASNPLVRRELDAGEPWSPTRARLEQSAGGRAFLGRWDAFMAEHGHHTRAELDLAVPRWKEQPDYVLAMIRGYLAAPPRETPLALHRRRAAEREVLTAECRRRLGFLRRRVFDLVLRKAQRGLGLRETAKSELVRRLALTREAVVEAGVRLSQRGILEEPGDVFFLSIEELPAALDGKLEGARGLVAARRREHAGNLRAEPPAVVVGRFDPRRPPPPPPDATVLRGVAVSPGVAEGRARVILRSDTTERLLAGEILVAPFTDPGWTPYFLPAAGIVMDQGGVLSHGSVVAREYGIPAVVNVGPATRVIRTGQLIRVDAHRGEVSLLEAGAP